MDGISFGGIYDAFDSFERQMEEGLANIMDEDDPPSVAVAASATQYFPVNHWMRLNSHFNGQHQEENEENRPFIRRQKCYCSTKLVA